jgi:hypothetical protein
MGRPGYLVGAWIALGLLLGARPAGAQTVRGWVEQADGVPIFGAFIMLEDSSGVVSRRVLSTESGSYRITAPAPGAYRLRAERIGYSAAVSPWLRLDEGEDLSYRFVIEPSPVRLREIRVEERARCTILPDEGIELQRVWDEALKAITATAWTGQQPYFRFDAVMHTQTLDNRGRPTAEAVLEEVRFYGRHPFRAIPAQDLVLGGFVQHPGGQVAYYAPDADVLLSDSFVRRHCFRLVRGRAESAGLLGLEFETLPQSRLPDIEGVMWLDPASSELRWLDFTYVNLDASIEQQGLGGMVEFARLPSGAWIIRSWWIRVPVVEWIPGQLQRPGRYRLLGIDEGGGQVVSVWLTARIAGLLSTDTLRVTPPPDSLLLRFDLEEPGFRARN